MAGYGLSQATQNFFNTKWAMEDRTRRDRLDEEARRRQAQLDEQNRAAQEISNASHLNSMTLANENNDRAQQDFQNKQDELNRQLNIRQGLASAAQNASSQPAQYDGQDFAPIEGDYGLRDARPFHLPTYLQNAIQADPSKAPEYASKLKDMEIQGVYQSALAAKNGDLAGAVKLHNDNAVDQVHSIFKKNGKLYVTHSDGSTDEFHPDKIIAQINAMRHDKPVELSSGAVLADPNTGNIIASNPWHGKGGSNADGTDGAPEKNYSVPVTLPSGKVMYKTFTNAEMISHYKEKFRFPPPELQMSDPVKYDELMKIAAQTAPPFDQWAAQFAEKGFGAPQVGQPHAEQTAEDFIRLWGGQSKPDTMNQRSMPTNQRPRPTLDQRGFGMLSPLIYQGQ